MIAMRLAAREVVRFCVIADPLFAVSFRQRRITSQTVARILATPPTSVPGSVGGDHARRMIQLKARLQF